MALSVHDVTLNARHQRAWHLLAVPGLIVLAACGCATIKPMALSDKPAALDTGRESVALMTIKTANPYRPSYQPNLTHVVVWSDDAERKRFSFKVDEPHKRVKDEFNDYLVSMSLPPGRYSLRELFGTSGIFPVRGSFAVPLYKKLELKPNSVIYLGRVVAVNRERKNDDALRAGPVIPLIDQAVTGFSGGTFDVQIVDNYDEDMAAFRQAYPALVRFTVERGVLPPWTKPSKEDMK
jgi:hypothetical protein